MARGEGRGAPPVTGWAVWQLGGQRSARTTTGHSLSAEPGCPGLTPPADPLLTFLPLLGTGF